VIDLSRSPTLLAILLAALVGCQQGETDPPRIEQVENSLESYTMVSGEPGYSLAERMDHHVVPGVSIAVIEDREIQWVKHYGTADVRDRRLVDDSTLFNVGSMSKAVTCAAVLSLARDGLVDLEAPVNQQLRSWTLPENELTREASVTPIRLMNHSGGVVFSPGIAYRTENLPTLQQILDGTPPSRSGPVVVDKVPGSTFQYSNSGYALLRLLVEDVTGQRFEDFVTERIFTPLGMTSSSFETPLPQALLVRAAMGHGTDGAVDADARRWIGHMAAGGLWTTARDYAIFIVEIQRTLLGESTLLMDQGLAEQMVSPHDAEQYGFGVFLRSSSGGSKYVGHIGDGPGFVGGYTFDTSGKHGVVALSNGRGGINLVREIRRSVAIAYEWQENLPAPRTAVEPDLELARQAAGRYRLGFDGVVSVTNGQDGLSLSVSGEAPVRMYQVGQSAFVARERDGEVAFERNDDGSVRQMIFDISDSMGRSAGEPRALPLMGPDERTPLELLLEGETERATALYRDFLASEPAASEISENRLNNLGYQLMGQDRADDAVAVLTLYTELYPQSSNAHDSRGEALMKSGRLDEAVASYQLSLELDPGNANAVSMIEKIQAERTP
jgi:CubicO group peptidase (beta-lactamase class C family)